MKRSKQNNWIGVRYVPWNGKVYFAGEVVKRYERDNKRWKLVWAKDGHRD